MIIPVRCWSCGKPVGHLWEKYESMVKESGSDKAGDVLDSLGLERYCCRAILLGHVDLLDSVMKFRKA